MTTLTLSNITMQHAHTEKPALDNISFTLNQGDLLVLLGRNGSGKSTLLKILTKQLAPSSGQVALNQQPLHAISSASFSRDVMILNQQYDDSLFPSLTLLENYLVISRNNKMTSKQHQQCLINQLQRINSNLAHKLHLPVHRLSGGEKQALALAFVFLNGPKLLLLDEHTSALDPKTSSHLMNQTNQFIRSNQLTCIMTTHDLDLALTYGNKLLILQDGRVIKMIDHHEKSCLTKEQLIYQYY